MIAYILIILLMVILSAFFSGSEISFNASNKMRLKKNAEEGKKSAVLAMKINNKFTEALSAILIGNNLANIAASTAATLIFTRIFAGVMIDEGAKSTLVTVLSTAIMTVLILIFGEISPKIIAKQNADRIVCLVAYPIRVIWLMLFPVVKLVMVLINLLRKSWGKDKADDEPTVTESELSSIIETIEEEGVIDGDKSNMLQSALEFPETTVSEIMTPRTNFIAIDIEDSFEKIKETIESSHFTRLPVYENSVDNIIGILSLNRYYKEAVDHDGEFDIRPLLLKPCFLHKTIRLPAALRVMREKQTHISIIIDEFGGTMGIVTMEDILEEIVGEIWDETDEIIHEITMKSDGVYEVNGDMNVYDFFDETDVHTDNDFNSEYSTVGGWVTEMLHAEPHVGDKFDFKNLTVTVTGMDEIRVTTVSVEVCPTDDDDYDDN